MLPLPHFPSLGRYDVAPRTEGRKQLSDEQWLLIEDLFPWESPSRAGGRPPVPPGRPRSLSDEGRETLHREATDRPDATLSELRERSGIDGSLTLIHNELRRLGFSRTKSRSVPPSETVRTHRQSSVRRAMRDAEADVRFLPPYSPDRNPIEKL